MNKLLISFVSLVLLAGCGEAEKKDASSAQPEDQQAQSQPATAESDSKEATTAAPQDNTATPEKADEPQKPDDTAKDVQVPAETEKAPVAPEKSESSPAAVIDATNEQTLTESLDKMIVNLTEEEKETFSEAFLIYAMSQVDMSLSEEENQKKMLAALNGKSVQDILNESAKLKQRLSNQPQADKPSAEQPESEKQDTTPQESAPQTTQPSSEGVA